MDLPILTAETAPAASQPVLEGIAADLGFVPNLAATIAASPTLLRGFDGLRRAVGDESFEPQAAATSVAERKRATRRPDEGRVMRRIVPWGSWPSGDAVDVAFLIG